MIENLMIEVLKSLIELIILPFKEPSLLWQLSPIFLIWIFMTFYFGTHKHEQLGWNTALGNGISLFWIIISALQFIFENELKEFTITKFYLIIIITIYAVFIIYSSFKHLLSDKLTYALASPTPIYYFSALTLLYAHNLVDITIPTIIAIIILFIIIMIVIKLIETILPEMKEDEEENESTFKEDDFSTKDFDLKDDKDFNNDGFAETGDFKPIENDPFNNQENPPINNEINSNTYDPNKQIHL